MIILLINLVHFTVKAISFLVFIRIILSFVEPNPYNPVVQWIHRLTEPILAPFRRLPLVIGMLDFSPMVALLVVYIVGNFIINLLISLARI